MSIKALSGSGLSPASPVGNAYASSLTLSGGVVKNPYTGTGVTITIGVVNGTTSTITLTGTNPAWTSAMTVNSVLQATGGTGSLGTGTVIVTSVVSSVSVNISSTATMSAGTITDLLIVSYGTGVFSAPASLTANTTLSTGLTINGSGGLIVSSGNLDVGGNLSGSLAPRVFIPAAGFVPDSTNPPSVVQLNGIYAQQFTSASQISYVYFPAPINWARNCISVAVYGTDGTSTSWTIQYMSGAPTTTFTNPTGSVTGITSQTGTTNGLTSANYTAITATTQPNRGAGIMLRISAANSGSGSSTATMYGVSLIFT